MNNKKLDDRAFALQQELEQSDLQKQQGMKQALITENQKLEQRKIDERSLIANRLMGRIQMANGFAKLATVATAADLTHIKDNVLYQGVTIVSEDGGLATIATWEEFCALALGVSRRSADYLIANYKAFGAEAFDAMQRAGIGPTRLNKLRATLSDEEKNLIISGIEVHAGDTKAIQTIVDDVIAEQEAKHAQEKDGLTKQVADLQGTLQAREQVLKNANKNKTQLEEEIEKLKGRKPDERIVELTAQIDSAKVAILARIRELERIFENIGDAQEGWKKLDSAAALAVAQVRSTLNQVQREHCLDHIDLDDDQSSMQQAG
ncbi:hypothetical protein [Zhongshania sp.]|uniref:hypothetical protein n=1 Tax=Zhongshania sp. TaxID=1971902 RepID=UPI001B7A6D4F|nr:hypothetical protein [Zhongshania sp.]MBQ0796247.1 hypothetical protein [Zhongshania sp.]